MPSGTVRVLGLCPEQRLSPPHRCDSGSCCLPACSPPSRRPSGPGFPAVHRAAEPNKGGPARRAARACPRSALARCAPRWSRQGLKPRPRSTSSQDSVEPPGPRGSRSAALVAGPLVLLGRQNLGSGSRNRRKGSQVGVSGTGRCCGGAARASSPAPGSQLA